MSNGPTAPSVLDLPAARITAIQTYHWNNAQGATPGTISLRAQDGTVYGPFPTTGSPGQGGVPNAYWTAIQIRNHRYPIAKVEGKDSTGSAYVDIPRVDYNYFVDASGLGPGPYALRVTDTRGHVLEDSSVPLGDDVTRQGTAQFPACD